MDPIRYGAGATLLQPRKPGKTTSLVRAVQEMAEMPRADRALATITVGDEAGIRNEAGTPKTLLLEADVIQIFQRPDFPKK